jgi:hypothetical protein
MPVLVPGRRCEGGRRVEKLRKMESVHSPRSKVVSAG